MSEPLGPQEDREPEELAQAPPDTVASRLALSQRAGGIIVPVMMPGVEVMELFPEKVEEMFLGHDYPGPRPPNVNS